MNDHINNLKHDLSDPALDTTLELLHAAKPDAPFSDKFAAQLRSRLTDIPVYKKHKSPYSGLVLHKLFYGSVGSVLTMLLIAPLTYMVTRMTALPTEPQIAREVKHISSQLTFEQQISDMGTNAFGTIPSVTLKEEPQPLARNVAPATEATMMAMSADAASTSLAADGYAVPFVYGGDKLVLKDSDKLFKRVKGIESGKQLAELIQKTKFSIADLGSFANFGLKSIELAENKEYGYVISMDVEEGMISITPNADRWKPLSEKATSSATLSDEESLALANEFIEDHAIDTSIYGKPVVLSKKGTATSTVVIYPLAIEGKSVVTESGEPFGIEITLDTVYKRVYSVMNLTSQTYESSVYKLETDFNKILTNLAQPETVGTKKLPTPQEVLMRYVVKNSKGRLLELYIPAYSFDDDGLVVPLIKDFHNKVKGIEEWR